MFAVTEFCRTVHDVQLYDSSNLQVILKLLLTFSYFYVKKTTNALTFG